VPSSITGNSLVVITAAGGSDPFLVSFVPAAPGIFTLDGSGCGHGVVLNVHADGSVALNSPAESVSPGEYAAAFGTGAGFVEDAPPDGSPATNNPLARAEFGAAGVYDFTIDGSELHNWSGRAPGLVGVDQFNVRVPEFAREGCAVPFQVLGGAITQPVTLAISQGRRTLCRSSRGWLWADRMEKKTSETAAHQITETETITISLQASPGQQPPVSSPFNVGPLPGSVVALGPACPIPGYRSLAAGKVTADGPGFGPVETVSKPLDAGYVSGLATYQATLPAGSVQSGDFTVAAAGGADVAAFRTTVRVGSNIQITTALPGIVFPCDSGVPIRWTGGDPDAWVTISQVIHDPQTVRSQAWRARVSDGTFTVPPVPNPNPQGPGQQSCGGGDRVPIDLVIEVGPDPQQAPTFAASGLSLGGLHTWKYSHHFEASLIY
jgi:uncharacterized protein (TIGR03437 family)